jgi:hypothetical protein
MAFERQGWRRDLAAASVGFAVGSTLVGAGAIRWHQVVENRRRDEMRRSVDERVQNERMQKGMADVE